MLRSGLGLFGDETPKPIAEARTAGFPGAPCLSPGNESAGETFRFLACGVRLVLGLIVGVFVVLCPARHRRCDGLWGVPESLILALRILLALGCVSAGYMAVLGIGLAVVGEPDRFDNR